MSIIFAISTSNNPIINKSMREVAYFSLIFTPILALFEIQPLGIIWRYLKLLDNIDGLKILFGNNSGEVR